MYELKTFCELRKNASVFDVYCSESEIPFPQLIGHVTVTLNGLEPECVINGKGLRLPMYRTLDTAVKTILQHYLLEIDWGN